MIKFSAAMVVFWLAISTTLVMGMGAITQPPPPYDQPFTGKVIYERVSWWDVPAICHIRGVSACAWRILSLSPPAHWVCHIIMPILGTGGITHSDIDDLDKHERGHCNGWAADHPGAHY